MLKREILRMLLAGGSGGPPTIGGVALGALGTGVLANFKLQWGDEFNALPSRWSGANPTGAYSSSTPQNGNRNINTGQAQAIYLDPSWRGINNSSPTSYGLEPLSQASSVVTISTTAVSNAAPYYASLPTTYTNGYNDANSKPVTISGCLDTWPSYLVSAAGDFAVVCRMRFPAGVARGWWPAFWTTNIGNWPDYGEIDVTELKKDSSGNVTSQSAVHESASDGGGDVPSTPVAFHAITAGAWRQFVCAKVGGTLTFYDDQTTPGTLAVTGTFTDAKVARIRGGHRIRIETAVAQWWDSSTYAAADWPSSMDIDMWQVWTPSASYVPYVAPMVLPAINVAPGGSWATTLPAVATLYGATPTIEEIYAAFDNTDAPGRATVANNLPGGMTVNASTRAVTGTVPTTNGGATGLLMVGSFATGGQALQALQMYNVAPAVLTLFSNQGVTVSTAFSVAIAFTDFHSGNLGPHTYTVTSDQAWAVVTYGSNNWTATIAGTAPSSASVANITVTATNKIGQTTVATRTITAGTATTYSDSFTYANGSLETVGAPNWTRVAGTGAAGDAAVSSNVVITTTADSVGSLYLSPDLASQRQYVQGNLFNPNSGFLVLQATDANNFIGVRRNPTSSVVEVYKKVTGTLTLQAGFAETLGDTDLAYMSFISNVLVVKKNGTALVPTSGASGAGSASLTVASGPAASTRTGFVVRLNGPSNNALDNYQAGVL